MSLMMLQDFISFVDGLDHPEGVTWGPDGFVYAGGEAGQIYRIDLNTGHTTVIGNTGGFILGLCLDADGNVYACDTGHHAVMRITQSGEVTSYSLGLPDRKMVTPNYPAFDSAGNLYVSDSGSWHGDDGCLFRIEPGGATQVVSTAVSQFPNGIALHPDGETLYVVLSTWPGVARVKLNPDGPAGTPEPVIEMPRTVPDGVAFDKNGNLYISCYTPDVIYRLSPDGELEMVVEDWESTAISSPTNVAFGGEGLKTLLVASLSRWHLAKAEMTTAGHPLHYPKVDG